MKKKISILIFLTIFLTFFVLAFPPGIPHQFYGNVFIDGIEEPNGIIEAEIVGEIVKTYEFSNGVYGHDPIFFVTDPEHIFNGELIIFYVNGIEAGQHIFKRGGITKLDLNVSIDSTEEFCGDSIIQEGEFCDDGENNGIVCDNSQGDCNYCSLSCEIINLDGPGDGGMDDNDTNQTLPPQQNISMGGIDGGGTPNSLKTFCEVNWKCSGWSECDGGVRTRTCKDKNHCEEPYNIPVEKSGCQEGISSSLLVEPGVNWFPVLMVILVIVLMVLLGVLVRN